MDGEQGSILKNKKQKKNTQHSSVPGQVLSLDKLYHWQTLVVEIIFIKVFVVSGNKRFTLK